MKSFHGIVAVRVTKGQNFMDDLFTVGHADKAQLRRNICQIKTVIARDVPRKGLNPAIKTF